MKTATANQLASKYGVKVVKAAGEWVATREGTKYTAHAKTLAKLEAILVPALKRYASYGTYS